MPTGRMIAFTMALMGCLLIMYKAIWYDQFSCPDGFLLRVRPALWAPGLGRTVEPRKERASKGPTGSPGEGLASPPLTDRRAMGVSSSVGTLPPRNSQVLALEKFKEKGL